MGWKVPDWAKQPKGLAIAACVGKTRTCPLIERSGLAFVVSIVGRRSVDRR